jgi:hypothetical protein
MSNRLVSFASQDDMIFLGFTVALDNGRRRLGCENGFRIRAVELFESFDRTPNCLFQLESRKQIVALRNLFFFFFVSLLMLKETCFTGMCTHFGSFCPR